MQLPPVKEALSARPGLAIVKFWQGAVEIALRAGAIVLGFVTLVATAVTLYKLRYWSCRDDYISCNFPNSARFLLIVALGVMVYEAAVITVRFINFNFVSAFSKIIFIMDICITAVIAIFLLIGAAVFASYIKKYYVNFPGSTFSATAVLSFFLLFELILLAIWMALFLLMKWNNKLPHYTFSSRIQDTEATAE